MTPRLSLWLLAALAVACAPEDPCGTTRDLTQSPAGLELTEEEHQLGWGNAQCFQCHQVFNIHAETCIDVEGTDVGAINEDEIDVDDTTTCIACHGANGVEEWQDTGALP